MATNDISRHLFQVKKRYSGARIQKGRAILDSDFNEAEMLDDESQRVIVADVVGGHGSPDNGFTIRNVSTEIYDFEIAAGTYYLAGMRHEIAGIYDPTQPQTFRAQSNWLQFTRQYDEDEPALPTEPRHDLVYLVGWEQPVSAAEDDELLEQALRGRDAGQRVRRMARVMVLTDVHDNCAQAFEELRDDLYPFDANTYERLPKGALKVVVDESPTPDELCALSPGSGYSRAENQAIRVQLIGDDRFLWGYDNASPLYRITARVDEGVVAIEFLTPPQEQRFFPLKQQILEILPWGARLANGEYVADHPIAEGIGGGVYARVSESYNPRTRTLKATINVPADLTALLDWFDDAEIPVEQRFLFLRVWNPGDNAPAEEAYGIPIPALDDPIPLEGTGLQVQFSAIGVVGDYWTIAARPSAPGKVVPWELSVTSGEKHGPRRFYCPLAIIHWSIEKGKLVNWVSSCRRTFRPLTRLGGCCSVTVGDGASSFGEYTSINEAIQSLPPDRPGKVCVLAGVYEERVVVERSNLVIEGCGVQSVIRTPAGNATSAGLISVSNCSDVTLRDLKIEATGQFGVTVLGLPPNAAVLTQRIKLENLSVTTRRDATLDPPAPEEMFIPPGSAAFPLCTIGASGVIDLSVTGCTLTMVGDLGVLANVLLAGCWRAIVRECKIVTPPGAGTVSAAWGGVHVAGYCRDVLIERNTIEQGLGHGITLGSVHVVPTGGSVGTVTSAGPADPGTTGAVDPGDDCPGVGGGLPFTAEEGERPVPVAPDPGPEDVRICRNRISGMGGSGISVLGFAPEGLAAPVPQIQTHRLVIADNIIEDNYRHPAESPLPPELRVVAAFGGIVLADADMLRIHHNVIRRNGLDHVHPVCGIYVLHGENILIEDNRIDSNGLRVAGDALAGHRAGIALQLVGRLLSRVVDAEGTEQLRIELDERQPAARVRGNVVIQPAGRALQIYGLGLMSVQGNTLISEGLAGLSPEDLADEAHCVEIQNLGQARELMHRGSIPSNVAIFPDPPLLYDVRQLNVGLLDGRVQFNDNQVRFNPVSGAATNIFCATRLQSYDDIAVNGNQFFVKFPPEGGSMLHDTIVVAWSTRTVLNRWEDPVKTTPTQVTLTAASAQTLAFINATTMNQASRCIFVAIAAGASVTDHLNADDNLIYDTTGCVTPQ